MAWSAGNFTRTNGTYSGSAVWTNDLSANVKIVAGAMAAREAGKTWLDTASKFFGATRTDASAPAGRPR